MTFELQKATAKNAKKLKKFKGIKFSKMKAVDKKALKKKWFVQYRIRAVFKYGNAKFVSGWQFSKKIKGTRPARRAPGPAARRTRSAPGGKRLPRSH